MTIPWTEEDLQRVKQNWERGSTDARRTTVKRGSSCEAATQKTKSRSSEPAPAPSFRSKWEAAYASKLAFEQRVGIIKAWWYEPFSLWLPGRVRYKPDFLVQIQNLDQVGAADSWLELVEVKGWSKNRRDGMTRLKIAAALFPCFVWRLVWMKKGGGWDGEYL